MQCVQGALPLHFVFFLRHESHARETRCRLGFRGPVAMCWPLWLSLSSGVALAGGGEETDAGPEDIEAPDPGDWVCCCEFRRAREDIADGGTNWVVVEESESSCGWWRYD